MLNGSGALFSARDLTKTFPGGNKALAGINLDIYPGECLLLAGSNGSGKTVLMRILTGLLEPTGGELFFRGRPLNRVIGELRRSVGLVFQDADAQFIGETVEEDTAFGPANLGFSKPEISERVRGALEAVGLTDKRAFPPRRLSGGEKRRLAAAGILAMGCETVIFDEPFANLDWPGVVLTLEIIRDLKNSGKTVILLTHELEKVLAFADRLVILHRGCIRDDGRPEEVIQRLNPVYGVRDPRRRYESVRDCTWLEARWLEAEYPEAGCPEA
ncbi:MAG: energy-coupling factor ABC transporter ATP-binding protein [Spirochaetaceae bacterium]|jgi:biotin transport system ATP-binding protein|nr:energy-coupling factor ABC transporter ATP-binding protein [Spirochaetaceae bacterium]